MQMVLKRQVTLELRGRAFLMARLMQTVIISLILASLFATIEPVVQDGRSVLSVAMVSSE